MRSDAAVRGDAAIRQPAGARLKAREAQALEIRRALDLLGP